MTDAVQAGMEWVPPVGMLEVPAAHAAVIRGLFELAAFVADHPELPAPMVRATLHTPREFDRELPEAEQYQAARAFVDQLAAVLGVTPMTSLGGSHYTAERAMGPVSVSSCAITPAHMAGWQALMSYGDSVQPEAAPADGAGGAR
ncbi:hypothetical protein [Kribbella sp. VKM Ac-2566]|uniref:hypothetical protein n=1 Tax=Kribbella sp. VKM Ac-2566 TaxID=2512218 RepID=UPI0010639CF8|nr:hypothetical protein [Kribbella sp. VKM Ac-2566]TDW91102.1 hypothetical protein EV647_4671 [Kribbella sp. VKM Ac-2566]